MSFQVVFILPADLVDRRGGEVVVVIAELERRKGQNFKTHFWWRESQNSVILSPRRQLSRLSRHHGHHDKDSLSTDWMSIFSSLETLHINPAESQCQKVGWNPNGKHQSQ